MPLNGATKLGIIFDNRKYFLKNLKFSRELHRFARLRD